MDLDLIRNNLELDFRLKLYKDPCFPFLQSMGKKNIYQEFYLNQKKIHRYSSLTLEQQKFRTLLHGKK